jgi:hypothetical protein
MEAGFYMRVAPKSYGLDVSPSSVQQYVFETKSNVTGNPITKP